VVSFLIVVLMSQARILMIMAQDGMLPKALARVHARYKTPVVATVLTAVLAAILSAALPIALLGQMVSIGVLSAFIAVACAVLVWRRKYPLLARPFRTPWVPAVPIGAVLVCGYMAVGLPSATWGRFCIWMGLGLAIYWLYGARSPRRSRV